MQPDYASCKQCDEYRKATLRKSEVGLCHNCADKKHIKGTCWLCRRDHLPLEKHHLAGRKNASFTVPICLNCHAMLSRRQYEWPDLWRGVRCPIFLIFGGLDYCVLSSASAMPYELFSRQCKETMTEITQKTVLVMGIQFKVILLVVILALAAETFRTSTIKPIGSTNHAKRYQ